MDPTTENNIIAKSPCQGSHLQLNDSIVKRRTHPWPYGMKCKALYTGGFTFKLGQHPPDVFMITTAAAGHRIHRSAMVGPRGLSRSPLQHLPVISSFDSCDSVRSKGVRTCTVVHTP
jgi:hypothetical protein